jgi:hypothetical protein
VNILVLPLMAAVILLLFVLVIRVLGPDLGHKVLFVAFALFMVARTLLL